MSDRRGTEGDDESSLLEVPASRHRSAGIRTRVRKTSVRPHAREIPTSLIERLCLLPVGVSELTAYVEEAQPENLAYGDLPLGTGDYTGYHLSLSREEGASAPSPAPAQERAPGPTYAMGISRLQVYTRERRAFGRRVTEYYEPYGDLRAREDGDVPLAPLPPGTVPAIAREDIPEALIRTTYRPGMLIDPYNHIRILARRLGCVEMHPDYAYSTSKGVYERSLSLVIELVRPLDPTPPPQREIYRLSFVVGIMGDWDRVLRAYHDYLLSGKTQEASTRYVEELLDILSGVFSDVWGVPPQPPEEECVIVCARPGGAPPTLPQGIREEDGVTMRGGDTTTHRTRVVREGR